MQGYCLDVEADDFYFGSTLLWVIWLKDLYDPSKKLEVRPFQDKDALDKIICWNNQYDNPTIVFHFGLGYDIFVLMKILGLKYQVGPDSFCGKPCQFVDTLYLSMYVNPDLQGHSIEAYGERFGFEKIDYRGVAIENGIIDKNSPKGEQFKHWSPHMSVYCERDVDINIKVFHHLMEKFVELYGNINEFPRHYKCGQKSFYLMSCQSLTGWKFDTDAAEKLKIRIEDMMEEIRASIEPKLPPRRLKKAEEKSFTMPKKPFKKDGSLSTHMNRFVERTGSKVLDCGTKISYNGVVYNIEPETMLDVQMPMQVGNQSDMKEWFLSLGWKPTYWNFQKDSNGKPIREKGNLIKTSPKIQEQGKICPNLEKMDIGIVQDVVKWLSLRNRLSILEGWLKHPRLEIDGRLPANRTGITPTHRQKHADIVNVPKASDKVILGKEFRSLFICDDGMRIAAGDASALEGRVEGHYTFKYDNGVRASVILDGDEHSKNAKIFYPEETKPFDVDSPDFDKDAVGFKPYRDRSKNGRYALTYGCSPKKLAETLGKPLSDGERLYKAFWDGNPSLKLLRESVEKYWKTRGSQKYLPAIDGRLLITRKKSALLNTIFQACGAIAMDYAACLMDSWLGGIKWDKDLKPYYNFRGHTVRRIGYFHDELEFECDEEIAVFVSKMIEKSIQKAGEILELKVPLVGEGLVGGNWCEVH